MRRHRRHFPFYVATLAAMAGLVMGAAIGVPAAPVLAANLFFICYLVFALRALARLEPRHVMEAAGDDDLPVALIFLVTLAAAGASLAALFVLVNSDDSPQAVNLIITLAAVPLGWLTVHIMAAMHYAHVYWNGCCRGCFRLLSVLFPGTLIGRIPSTKLLVVDDLSLTSNLS